MQKVERWQRSQKRWNRGMKLKIEPNGLERRKQGNRTPREPRPKRKERDAKEDAVPFSRFRSRSFHFRFDEGREKKSFLFGFLKMEERWQDDEALHERSSDKGAVSIVFLLAAAKKCPVIQDL